MTKSTSPLSKFETDLQAFFPDLFQFHQLIQFDKKYAKLIDGIMEMVNQNGYGSIKVIYQKGKINYVIQEKHLTAETSDELLTKHKSRL
jgi:uncharacterized protein (DUF2344 family)